jgi:hypothetical protein
VDSTTTTALPGVGDTIPAPKARLSADGHSATAGRHRLTVSAVEQLDPKGATVTVTGTGYETFKGIYVAFCVRPKLNQVPTPCGGGADTTGSTGASQWVSSNPPPYGRGLAVAYGPNGSFTAQLHVVANLNTQIDCRQVQCAVSTRNDHTRSTDRSQDLFVPVTFQGSRLVSVPADGTGDDGGGIGWALPVAVVVVAIGAIVGGILFARRHRSRERTGASTAPSVPAP